MSANATEQLEDVAGTPSAEKHVEADVKTSQDRVEDEGQQGDGEPLPVYEGHSSQRMLRVMTYLCPGLRVAIFEDICHFLEKVTGLPTYLMYESRWSGPVPSRDDPLTTDACDIVFMCSTAYLSLKERKCRAMELCTAAPLYSHKLANGQPVYFSEIVVHTRNVSRYKNFSDLKGSRFAFNDEISLSGNVAMMSEVRKKGYGAHFFGDKIKSGGHMESLKMVLKGVADVAAIDSNSLKGFQTMYPDQANDLVIMESIGPLPIYPIVFNKRLSGELKTKITKALFHIDKQPEFSQRLFQKGIIGFSKVDDKFYDIEDTIRQQVQQITLHQTYY